MTDKVQWKTLPTKANREMEQAGADAAREYLERTGSNNLWVIYEAMAAAAPKPPASAEPVVVALVAEDEHQFTDVIQCDGIHSLPVGTELIDRSAYDLCRAEVLELMAALDKARGLLHTASVHLARWMDVDDLPRQQIIEFLEGIDTPVERDERAGFEAYAISKGWESRHLKQRPDGGYEDWGVQPQWLAWQARAALARTT